MVDCTIKLEEKLIKPNTKVVLGPDNGKFVGEIYCTTITLNGDDSSGVMYGVQWWDDKICYRNQFYANELEVVDE